ncbi:30S ribosomal protein S19 [Candidatus Dojkabacteria bacterium]|uniref:Small ribosomal subunit protein uS19 n=1 Tax=Candidatus Dojkabacteria bacterium TaxID=2099670 RepID=A0A3M0YY46_9BACT|nr:MAG: 30S ribosomal protein S19 [Candidatus Dojkabacteria bacterium]
MSRSLKKGFFVDPKLLEKVNKARLMKSSGPIRTWSRSSTITPEMVGLSFEVHNGKYFHKVFVTESMIGHKLGEFSLTRRFTGHTAGGKIAKTHGSTGRVMN